MRARARRVARAGTRRRLRTTAVRAPGCRGGSGIAPITGGGDEVLGDRAPVAADPAGGDAAAGIDLEDARAPVGAAEQRCAALESPTGDGGCLGAEHGARASAGVMGLHGDTWTVPVCLRSRVGCARSAMLAACHARVRVGGAAEVSLRGAGAAFLFARTGASGARVIFRCAKRTRGSRFRPTSLATSAADRLSATGRSGPRWWCRRTCRRRRRAAPSRRQGPPRPRPGARPACPAAAAIRPSPG